MEFQDEPGGVCGAWAGPAGARTLSKMEPCVTPRPAARQMALEPRTPSSIFKVRGKHQELGCELDRANLQLGEPLAPENGSHAQVFAGVYHEPETGISHEVAAKRFEIASSRHQVQSIHREIGCGNAREQCLATAASVRLPCAGAC